MVPGDALPLRDLSGEGRRARHGTLPEAGIFVYAGRR